METRQFEELIRDKPTSPVTVIWRILSSDIPVLLLAILFLVVLIYLQ